MEIDINDIVTCAKARNIFVVLESAEGMQGDKTLRMEVSEFTHASGLVYSIVDQLDTFGKKLTIFGQVGVKKKDDSTNYIVSINYSVGEPNESRSDPTPS